MTGTVNGASTFRRTFSLYSCIIAEFIHNSPSLLIEYLMIIFLLHFRQLGIQSNSLDSSRFIIDLSYLQQKLQVYIGSIIICMLSTYWVNPVLFGYNPFSFFTTYIAFAHSQPIPPSYIFQIGLDPCVFLAHSSYSILSIETDPAE